MKLFNQARKYGAKIAAVGATTLAMVSTSHAAGEFDAILDAVDLSGIATKIGALALVVVTVALIFKGPDLAKRIIRKV
nr:hypothetical protein [uncultured Albidiferax sp.]